VGLAVQTHALESGSKFLLKKKWGLRNDGLFASPHKRRRHGVLAGLRLFCDNHVTRLKEWFLYVRYLASSEILRACFTRSSYCSSGSIVCPQATLLGLLRLVLLFML